MYTDVIIKCGVIDAVFKVSGAVVLYHYYSSLNVKLIGQWVCYSDL